MAAPQHGDPPGIGADQGAPVDDQAAPDTGTRIAAIASSADPAAVVEALTARRDEILSRWLDAATRQPFHQERPEGAVADHIPALFDALVELLGRNARAVDDGVTPPMDDPVVARQADAHAEARFEQGLGPVAIVTEFRLLRHEIARALGSIAADEADPADVVGGLAVINDGLDGAATIGLTALSTRIETLRESFLATTLHDIRQPITLVEGSLVLAERWLGSAETDLERIRGAIADALSATTELVAMIDTMSDASRVAMGALDPDPEPVSLEAVVHDTVAAFGAADRTRMRIDVADGPRLIGLWDAGLLRRLVANLVGNALKYSPGGTEVMIVVGPGESDRARLIVRDRGLGMSREELDAVFGRFARADRVRRQGIPGLGLGLYACHGIVAAHGGTIVVTSDGAGQGAVVTVDLPLLNVDGVED
jgi:signal transduction histidine kinase